MRADSKDFNSLAELAGTAGVVFDTTTVAGTLRAAKLIEGLATTATGVETGVVTGAANVAVVIRFSF